MESGACGVVDVELGGAAVAPRGTDGVALARSGDGGFLAVVAVRWMSDWLKLVLMLIGW